MTDLAGRAGIVTGGSRGIGRLIATALGGEGASIAIVFYEHVKAAHEVMGMLQEQGSQVVLIQADVAAPDAPRSDRRSNIGSLRPD